MIRNLLSFGVLGVVSSVLTGCGVGMEPLMPTPAVYTETGLDPLEHIPENEQWTPRRVYYATVRERDKDWQRIDYTNATSDEMSVGLALIGFGGPGFTWEELDQASRAPEREQTVTLSVAGVVEAGRFPRDATPEEAAHANEAGWFLSEVNDAIHDARDKDILIYVHGAKVNFYNACAFAAQLDHFMGRDMTSVAFSWPTRQDIVAYSFGNDVSRAYASAPALASLIELLAAETNARKIHVLCWSAGARVTTAGVKELRERHPELTDDAFREKTRLGTVYFAAGDVPTNQFIEALPTLDSAAERIIVTVSSNDKALRSASLFMGGGNRLGQQGAELTETQKDIVLSTNSVEVVNVSYGSEDRGFDITGHRYWFNHPWASSDVLLSIRTDFTPEQRGLVQGEHHLLWYMPDDYPERLDRSLREAEFIRWK
jgi:esterase/lipase superfamily enzyme